MTFIFGASGNDTITTSTNSFGGILASAAQDNIFGTEGDDLLAGGAGVDGLDGGDGNDTLLGEANDDDLFGSAGNDSLVGGAGNDRIEGDAGRDTYFGGLGADTFYVDYDNIGTLASAPDLIRDFNRTQGDRLAINDFDGVYNALLGADPRPLYWYGSTAPVAGLTVGTALPGGAPSDGIFAYWVPRLAGDGWVVADIDHDGVLDASDLAVFVDMTGNQAVTAADFVAGTFTELTTATILGTAGGDTIYPGNVSAGVTGGSPGSGNDSISGGNGNDSIFASGGNDTIRGDDGHDSVYGGDGDDLLLGGNGDDELAGGAGNDSIDGGAGYDVVIFNHGGATAGVTITLTNVGGVNTGLSTSASVNQGQDTFTNFEQVNGSNGNDVITVTSANTTLGFSVRGNGGNDMLTGTATPNTNIFLDYRSSAVTAGVSVDLALGRAADGLGGLDTISNFVAVRGSVLGDTLLGSAADERFRGRAGDDYIDGRGGHDIADYSQATEWVSVSLEAGRAFDGETGYDTLVGVEEVWGSAWDDGLIGSAADDVFNGLSGNDSIYGMGGQDRVSYHFTAGNSVAGTRGVVVNLSTGTEPDGMGGAFVVGIAADAWGGMDTLYDIERVTGTGFADSMLGGAESNRFRGRGGNDTLDGGLGGDYAEYQNATTGATVNLTTGVATDGEGGTDRLISIEHVIGGNFADHLTGVAQLGRSTSLLRGGLGDDTLVGIHGEYVVADYADQTAGLSINLATGTANDGRGGTDTLIDIRGLNMFGAFADTLIGSAANEWFSPSGGADSVVGGAGFDIIAYGGTDTGGVSVNLLSARARDTGGAIDTITGFEGVTTAFGNDTIIGNPLRNLFGPGAGADSVHGGAGEDTVSYSLGFSPGGTQYGATEDGGRLPVQGVTVNLLTQRATDFAGDADTFSSIEHAIGSTAHDLLRGNGLANNLSGAEGNDTIEGGAGDDTLDGGAGVDRMLGGIGNDTYLVDSAADVVTEALNQGTDTIRTGLAAYVLKPNVENLVATNGINHTFTGNALGNAITGGAGADTIIGGAGNDTLDGGAGINRLVGGLNDDVYVVTIGDVVVEALNQGTDAVFVTTGTAYTLGANLETLVLAGATLLTGTGNGLANTLIGNDNGNILQGLAGRDVLEGGGGIDTLVGGANGDSLTGGTAGDRFRYLAVSDSTAADADVILDFTHSVAAGIDRVDLTMIDANSLVAGNQAFTYIGNAVFGGLGAASAGQLRYEVISTDDYSIRGDVNGDGTEDFVTNIISTFAPQQSWFML